jgi:3-mercaptopyruvate sulfurtransferase SseA
MFDRASLLKVAAFDDAIVLYFTAEAEAGPAWSAAKAVVWGYEKVYFFAGGAPAWKEAGFPIKMGE